MSDEEAIRQVLAGDHEAFRTLVDRYAPLVFHAIRQRACPESEVEDLAQDVFVKAFEGLPGFRGTAAFSSWLYQIAMNRSTDHLRRRGRRGPLAVAEPLSEDLPAPTSQRTLEQTELAGRFHQALDRLPDAHAEAFRLRYEDDLSYEEIADRLGVSEGALRVRIHRARMALRTHLADVL